MMKRAIIVHCWGGNSNYAWYPWAKSELEKLGYEVIVPDMPDPDPPKLATWLPHLQEAIVQPDDELVLIGHSIGTVTIMRYLEALEGGQVGKVILVAGFTDQLGFSELENFFDTRLDFGKIKPKSKNGFVAIQSDNDPFVSEQYGERLKDELGAKLVIKHNANHMSGAVDGEEACTELKEIIENI
ncbi:MAG TPA: alpha/beta fold hydrolase [Candidatus Saccharimonadales bacterium]|nr:alpha/beta fold hydrolase [Candidatus Saccharimonadales bacterium]